jgi:hypothetical protein
MKFSLLGGLLFAGLISILLAGCGQTEVLDSGYDIDEFGIVNDSMAILSVSYWDHVKNGATLMSSSDDYYETTGLGLLLVDMRQQKIYSEISLSSDLGGPETDQILDSLMFFWNFVFDENEDCKINKTAYLNVLGQKEKNILTLDSIKDSTDILSLWEKGLFDNFVVVVHTPGVFLGNVPFILDINEKSLREWEPTGDDVWLSGCSDFRLTPLNLRCLMMSKDGNRILVVNENREILDSLDATDLLQPRFYGNYISSGYTSGIHKFYKLNADGRVFKTPIYTITKYVNYIKFQDSTGNTTSYNGGTQE